MTRSNRRDAVLLGFLVVLGYLLLGQDTLYRMDGHLMLDNLLRGNFRVERHQLALPLIAAFRSLVGLVHELPMHRTITVLSALGSALGIAFTFLGCVRLGLTRGASWLAALMVATVFPVLFFATTVEYHGLFLAFAQAAFWISAGLIRRPRMSQALWLGLGAGVATIVHSSGLFLGFLLVCWFLGWTHSSTTPPLKSRLQMAGVALLTQATLLGASVWTLRKLDLWAGVGHRAFDYVEASLAAAARLVLIPKAMWEECALPFLPISAVALLLLWRREFRARCVAIAVGVLPYVAFCAIVLELHTEHGVYLVPAAALVCVLLVQCLRPWISAALIVITAIVGTTLTIRADTDGGVYTSFTAFAHEVTAPKPPFVVLLRRHWRRDTPELDEKAAILVSDPSIAYLDLAHYADHEPEQVAELLGFFRDYVERLSAGRGIVISATSIERLQRPEDAPAGPAILAQLRKGFRMVPVQAHGQSGFLLVSR